ncbi:uncharacterized protein CDAR_108211 [Caerostris darwini]|uniref:Uncharacterized protein n=1 Tax=Caerostris darwini TaxID=1538125 RepID=A0AAV4X539_9ARAC|nr:uncharacterized protein CDAR_108211 [Caerostris darwini]
MHTNEEDGFSRNKVSNELPDLNLNSKKDEDKAPAGHYDIHTLVCGISSTSDPKNMEGDILDVASLSSFSEDGPQELNIHLRSIKHEMKILITHFVSLKKISQFLVGIFGMSEIEDDTINNLLSKTLDEVKEFIFDFDDLEYSVTLVENTTSEVKKIEECQKVVKLKENLLSKLLGCYANIATIFQTISQKQSSNQMSKAQKDQDILQKQLQESEKKRQSQEAIIKDLENKLSILQGKVNTLESYKSTLEDEKKELESQLSLTQFEMQQYMSEIQMAAEYISEIHKGKFPEIEAIKENAQAEKTALKKALKIKKQRIEKSEQLLEKLGKELKDKEKMLLDIATQRDKLKLHLTVANNSIIEGKNQAEEMKHQNLKLQNELSEKENELKRQLQEMSLSVIEKTAQLNDSLQVKEKLEKSLAVMENDLEVSKNEIKSLRSKYADANILSQNCDNLKTLEDVRQLTSLLQSTQEYLKNIKSSPTHFKMGGGDAEVIENRSDMLSQNLLEAIEEVKEHLIDLKNQCSSFTKKDDRNPELETKLKEFQEKFVACSKEKDALMIEVEEMKNSRLHNPSGQQNDNMYFPENDFSVKTLQVELRLKNEENWRLKQREKDLVHQLEEVKEKLQKKEIENVRLFSLEEELITRKNEIHLLERKKEEESERLLNRIKDLQKTLDETTTEYERLKHYVQDIRSSYLNVFGSSS